MAEVRLKQVRSSNGSNQKQIATLRSLKLGKIGRESALEDTPQLRGMLAKVDHLVTVADAGGAGAEGGKAGGGGS